MQSKIVHILKNPYTILCRLFHFIFGKIKYKEFHYLSRVRKAIVITPKYISIGKAVVIEKNSRIEGVTQYMGRSFTPNIIFHDGVTIQQNCHITCANRIEIFDNTAIAANVTITDIHHPYDDISIPIERQNIKVKEVIIGEDSKIYNGAVIVSGVHIGKHVTVGANSVVTHDIPDYCVAVGLPARIIKRFDFDKGAWRNTNGDGSFIN